MDAVKRKSYGAMALDKYRAGQGAFEFWHAVGWLCTITNRGGWRELYEDGSSVYFPGANTEIVQFHDEELTRESLEKIGLYQAVHGALIL